MNSSNNLSSSTDESPCPQNFMAAMTFSWLALYVLLSPLFLWVVCVGYRQRKKRSAPSHSDAFTFHIIAMEALAVAGTCVYSVGESIDINTLSMRGGDLYNVAVTAQMFVHCLTCLDRYLAVVRPITYLRLRERGGVRVRNVSVVGVWLLSIAIIGLRFVVAASRYVLIIMFAASFLSVALMAFCSVSVLRALIRPGPGKEGVVDQSKRKAFVTMASITGVLLFRFVYLIMANVMQMTQVLSRYGNCVVVFCEPFFNFPSSLVLPLLYLQKAGKLPKCFIKKRKK